MPRLHEIIEQINFSSKSSKPFPKKKKLKTTEEIDSNFEGNLPGSSLGKPGKPFDEKKFKKIPSVDKRTRIL